MILRVTWGDFRGELDEALHDTSWLKVTRGIIVISREVIGTH